MEQEDGGGDVGEEQPLTSFNISETELISLHQGGGMEAGDPPDSSHHLSQGDLEALASIQEELDRMASAGQNNIISEEIVMGDGNGLGTVLADARDQVLVQAAFEPTSLDLSSLVTSDSQLLSPNLGGARQTVRVVKRPSTGGLVGQAATKVRVGEVGSHQIRMLPGGQGINLGGQQVRLVNAAGNNLKTIAPSEPNFLNLKPPDAGGSIGNISIVNQDGSLTTLPLGGQGIRIVSGAGVQQVLPRPNKTQQNIQPQPQQIRIVPSQAPTTFKILNADGSLSQVSSSFIRPKSDLNHIPSTLSSPKKKTVSYSGLQLKSPQKVITLKPPDGGQGQIIRTADGRLISLQGAAKKMVMPVSSATVVPLHHSFSPTKIVIRDSHGNNVQTVPAGQARQATQVLRLDQPSDRVQYVRVVNSSGKSQTVPIRTMGTDLSQGGLVTVRTAPVMAAKGVSPGLVTTVPSIAGVTVGEQGEVVRHQERREESGELVTGGGGGGGVSGGGRDKPRVVTALEPQGVRPRKPCNCTKSQCLKLYCDCFANGEFCHNCNCNGCLNNLSNEEERQRSIKQCLDRNPNAFRPKIGKNSVEGERRHNKGCNCKRSGCLKNYCECYEAKIPCTVSCKCMGCKNLDSSTGTKALGGGGGTTSKVGTGVPGQGLNLGERWFKPSTSLRSKLLQAPTPLDLDDKGGVGAPRQPFSFVSQEVVEATCQCLLAQAEEGEKKSKTESEIERIVLEEFGRCLVQIIDFAGKTKKS